MAYTTHGHHIPGTIQDAGWDDTAHRCGGVRLCKECKTEASYLEIPPPLDFENFQLKARALVFEYADAHLDKSDGYKVYEVYVVWFCKTLQNWKALLSTTLSDGMYYEVTYNGDKKETYLDAYKKFENVVIPD